MVGVGNVGATAGQCGGRKGVKALGGVSSIGVLRLRGSR